MLLDVDPRPSVVDQDTLERQLTAHSRGHSGPPGAYQGKEKEKRDGEGKMEDPKGNVLATLRYKPF